MEVRLGVKSSISVSTAVSAACAKSWAYDLLAANPVSVVENWSSGAGMRTSIADKAKLRDEAGQYGKSDLRGCEASPTGLIIFG